MTKQFTIINNGKFMMQNLFKIRPYFRLKGIGFVFGLVILFLTSLALEIELIIPLFLLILFIYTKFSLPDVKFPEYSFLKALLLFVIIFVISYFIIKQGWSTLYIPFSAIPMLSAILFGNLEITLLITLASSVTCAAVAKNDYYLGLLFLISGIISSLLLKQIHRRIEVIRAGFIIGFVQAITLFFIEHFQITDLTKYVVILSNGLVSSIIVVGSIPLFEYFFKIITNISLLELADFNQPLLKRMIMEAPGTYHHSLVVGNLSEAACHAVGAHALLARIGAYYHDIGKLSKPEYFSENQSKESRHETLSPTMSKLIITNHVKEGIELAKKYRLNPKLIEFIQRHHGNSLVYYFYRRALENLEEDHEIKEEGFRYTGPKANTKETAIVLLADSVEAATRALQDPTPSNIEEVVHKIINNKFIDGQLDECDLTLKELEKISKVFVHILSGIYHSRVTYPEFSKSAPH